MKRTILLVCLCFGLHTAIAQQTEAPAYTKSNAFKEPEMGASRLLLMKNGNTLFFQFTRSKGVNVTVYDQQHQSAGVVNNRIGSWKPKKMKDADLKALFEVNGNAVVFLEQLIERRPTLYRLIFDGKTGKLLREEELAKNHQIPVSETRDRGYGNFQSAQFIVRKDPASEYYAIGVCNVESSAKEKEHIELIHFAPDHKVISRALFKSPGGTYRYLVFPDIYVNQDKYVFIACQGYNTKATGGQGSHVIIGRLQKGNKSFESKILDYTDDYNVSMLVLKHRKEDGLVYMLNAFETKKEDQDKGIMGFANSNYALEMNVLDPVTLEVKNHYLIKHPQLSAYAEQNTASKKKRQAGYTGFIQDFRLQDDGTITYLFEYMQHDSKTMGTGEAGKSASVTTRTVWLTHMGDIGIVNAGLDGKELSSFTIAKRQTVERTLDMFLINRRKWSSWHFRAGGINDVMPAFYSYDYLFVNGREYVFFNDSHVKIEDERNDFLTRKRSLAISNANTACATFDGKKVTKAYLFGEPAAKDENKFCQLEMITTSEDSKTMATMMIEKKGRRHKKAYIVWVDFK
ncbi:hypothetical protein [Chitinophaga sp. S165]|uniref:hypothetical protein n=1 Tax=Chitinophaga sp. S165 TaxID=2135462 RepID=UPI0011B4C691|nr:hypothetical protein [Chitinophaga sp. S165]